MNRVDPIVQRSFGFARRSPWWAAAIATAVVAFTVTAVTAPLVTDAAADRAFVAEADAAALAARIGQGLDARAYTVGVTDAAPLASVTSRLDELPVYGAPFMAVSPLVPYTDHRDPVPFVRNASGQEATAVVLGLDGPDAAVGTTPAGAGANGRQTGVRIPDTLAAELALRPGDEIVLGLRFPGPDASGALTATTTVAAVYATASGLPAQPGIAWGGTHGVALSDPIRLSAPARMLIADPSTAVSLLTAIGDTAYVTWSLAWQGPVTLHAGRDAADAVRIARGELIADDSTFGRAMTDVDGRPVVLSSGVGDFVDRADASADALEPLVSSVALAARILSGLIIVVGIALLTRSRSREHLLSLSMGAHPLRIAAVTVLEFLVPILIGTGAALTLVRWHPRLVAGRGAIARSTIDTAVSAIRVQPVLAALIVGITTLAVLAPMQPRRSGTAARWTGAAQGTTIAVVAAVVTGAQLVTMKGEALDSGTSLLFPLFTLLAGSALVVRALAAASVRLTRTGLGSGRRAIARPRSLGLWLTVRRLTAALARQSALAVMVSVGVGMFVYCWSIAGDGERGLADKVAALGGAQATLQLRSSADLTLGADGLPTELPTGQTVVWTATNLYLGVDLPSDLLVVDPRTFASGVAWGSSFAGRKLDQLLADLGDSPPGAVGIIVAGNYADDFPDTGRIELDADRGSIQYRVVERIAAAPWQRQRATMAIALADPIGEQLLQLQRPTGAAASDGAGSGTGAGTDAAAPPAAAALDRVFQTFVWSSGTQAELDARWAESSLETTEPNVPNARRQPEFVAYALFLPYLRFVGTGLLVASTVALVVLGARRRDDLALELAMTRRMAMPLRITVISVVGGSVATALVGAGTGVLLARQLAAFMTPRLDPGPSFAPPLVDHLASSAVLVAVTLVLVATVVSTAAELAGARRERVSEVLRAAE